MSMTVNTTIATAFNNARKEHPLMQQYNAIVKKKGWTHARKWVKEQKSLAAQAWKIGHTEPWTDGRLAGLW